jgi:uncharacterized iron-regulated membrane protein
VFLALVISGPYLWLPRKWSGQAIRASAVFRRYLRGRARDWNWHNVVGIWCAIPLFLITLTGVIMSYPWANNLLFRLAGSAPPVQQNRGDAPSGYRGERDRGGKTTPDLDALLDRSRSLVKDWRTISLRLPAPGDNAVTVSVDSGTGGEVEKRTLFVLDARTAVVVKATRFSDNSLGQRLRALARFTHTGEEGGFIGQAVGCLACLGGILLVWTGLSLAVRRARNSLAKAPASRPEEFVLTGAHHTT